jgi:phosphoribosyl 1,2-cyclic phosphodiesterase
MKLRCLGSSSKGNCYILESHNEALILECGVKLSEVNIALNWQSNKIIGCLCSHGHGDHSKFLKDFMHAGIPVFSGHETKQKLNLQYTHNFHVIENKKSFQVGSFTILPFEVIHDIQTFGFLIEQESMGKLVFITDTKYCPYKFHELNHILIEANYSLELMNERLINGQIQGYLYNRVMESHLSFEETKKFLLANDLSQVHNVVLLHLSDSNSHAHRFIQETKELTGKAVYVADSGLEIDLSLEPF